jgi:hypothetical protein
MLCFPDLHETNAIRDGEIAAKTYSNLESLVMNKLEINH